MTIKCLVVDDEPIALDILTDYIGRINQLELVGRCRNAMEAFDVLSTKRIDLLFLDIKMPQLTGIELLKSLALPPKVILTTAYPEYALEGYELNVLDYLLKPISYQRFLKSVAKTVENTNFYHNPAIVNPAILSTSFIYLKEDRKMIKVPLDEILYLEGMGNYVKVVTRQRNIITYRSLNFMEQQLGREGFLRIHKSFIIALNNIQAFTAETIEISGRQLPIGNIYKKMVLATLEH